MSIVSTKTILKSNNRKQEQRAEFVVSPSGYEQRHDVQVVLEVDYPIMEARNPNQHEEGTFEPCQM